MKATVCKLTPDHARHLRQLSVMIEESIEETLARVVETGLDAIDSLDGLLWDWALEVRDDAERAARVKVRVKRRLRRIANGMYYSILGTSGGCKGSSVNLFSQARPLPLRLPTTNPSRLSRASLPLSRPQPHRHPLPQL